MAAATATAQTGAMVMRNGRIVSLAECESWSNAMKTMAVPISRTTKPAITAGHLSDFTPGRIANYLNIRWSTDRRPGPVRQRLSATVPSSKGNSKPPWP